MTRRGAHHSGGPCPCPAAAEFTPRTRLIPKVLLSFWTREEGREEIRGHSALAAQAIQLVGTMGSIRACAGCTRESEYLASLCLVSMARNIICCLGVDTFVLGQIHQLCRPGKPRP